MRSRALLAALLASAAASGGDPGAEVDWSRIDAIVAALERPSNPRRDYRVADLGGRPDGRTDALPAIRAAIEKASAAGGGRVVLSKGVWLSRGPVHLRSRIELHLRRARAAVLARSAPTTCRS